MTWYLRDQTVKSALAFFVAALLLSFGAGLSIAAIARDPSSAAERSALGVVILASPTIAAIVLTVATSGWSGLRSLGSPLSTWRVPIRWYLVALFLPVALNLSSIGIYVLLGGSLPPIPGPVPADLEPLVADGLPATVLSISLFFLLASLAEEIGWRGYALPRLQSRMTAFASSLVLGAVWASWHVPAFYLAPGAAQAAIPFRWYLPSVLAISVAFTWIYNNTSGSLLVATIFHASIQATNILLPNLPAETGDARLYGLNVAVVTVVAAVLLAAYGSRNLTKSDRRVTQPEVTGMD